MAASKKKLLKNADKADLSKRKEERLEEEIVKKERQGMDRTGKKHSPVTKN